MSMDGPENSKKGDPIVPAYTKLRDSFGDSPKQRKKEAVERVIAASTLSEAELNGYKNEAYPAAKSTTTKPN